MILDLEVCETGVHDASPCSHEQMKTIKFVMITFLCVKMSACCVMSNED